MCVNPKLFAASVELPFKNPPSFAHLVSLNFETPMKMTTIFSFFFRQDGSNQILSVEMTQHSSIMLLLHLILTLTWSMLIAADSGNPHHRSPILSWIPAVTSLRCWRRPLLHGHTHTLLSESNVNLLQNSKLKVYQSPNSSCTMPVLVH